VIIVISNIGIAIAAPSLWSLPADLAPHGMGSSLAGIMNTFGFVGAITGPLITGYLLQKTGSFGGPMLLMAGLLLVGVIVSVLALKGVEERMQILVSSSKIKSSDCKDNAM
jgi:cyanate permease